MSYLLYKLKISNILIKIKGLCTINIKIAEMSKDGKHNVFLHQAALVGAILNNLKRREMQLLPDTYNYPLFFEKFYGSELQFDSIEDAVTLKCEFQYNQLPKDWDRKVKGSKDIISWLKEKWSAKNR